LTQTQNKTVFRVTAQIVAHISSLQNTAPGRAMLAELRNSIGKPVSQSIGIWPIVFAFMPEEFLSARGKLTWEEQAILTSLQLYALHQQGKSESVALQEETDKWENMGHSLRTLRTGDEKAVDRRFNALITAANYEELVHHLRQMIKLLKAKTDTKVNYAKLADDLYGFLRNYPETMRIRWAKAYYRTTMKKGEEDEQ
jgi:CRISPR system Cascade subunit CasB